jgi:hypothetical protein
MSVARSSVPSFLPPPTPTRRSQYGSSLHGHEITDVGIVSPECGLHGWLDSEQRGGGDGRLLEP